MPPVYPDLEQYIDQNYVSDKAAQEYMGASRDISERKPSLFASASTASNKKGGIELPLPPIQCAMPRASKAFEPADAMPVADMSNENEALVEYDELQIEKKLNERMEHMSDTFSQYLMYLIQERNMENADVYKRAIVDKKIFSKLKNNKDYQPQKITALCLCVGAKLNLDETKDLLSRAGYALSPCSKTDIIFSYFIENEIYDMIEIDIQLEEHGLPCIIS